MGNKKRSFIPPSKHVPADPTKNMCWCPLCDWKAPDSIIGRKRLGLHLGNKHPEDVLFPIGTEPDDLEPIPSRTARMKS